MNVRSRILRPLPSIQKNNRIKAPRISDDVLYSMYEYSDRFLDEELKLIAEHCCRLKLVWNEEVTNDDIEWIITEYNIPEKAKPHKSINNNNKSQRIMDSLSRLLSVSADISPCVAVMLFNQHIVIASNAPKKGTRDELKSNLRRKTQIIQEFLEKLYKSQQDDSIIEMENFVAIYEVVEKLIQSGGTDNDLIPIEQERPRATSVKERLIQDLLKISKHYLKGMNARKEGKTSELGFDWNQLNALRNTTVEVFVGGPGDHAEQGILHYYDKNIDKRLSVGERQKKYGIVPIGITKLCCFDCNSVLEKRKEVSYRGTHGISYPGTRIGSVRSDSFFTRATQMNKNIFGLTPEDSASDVEIKGLSKAESPMISVSDALRSSAQEIPMSRRYNFFPLLQKLNSHTATIADTPVWASQ